MQTFAGALPSLEKHSCFFVTIILQYCNKTLVINPQSKRNDGFLSASCSNTVLECHKMDFFAYAYQNKIQLHFLDLRPKHELLSTEWCFLSRTNVHFQHSRIHRITVGLSKLLHFSARCVSRTNRRAIAMMFVRPFVCPSV